MGFLDEISWVICFCIGIFAELVAIFFMTAAGRFTAPCKGLVISTIPMRNLENFSVVIAATAICLIFWTLHYGWAFLGYVAVFLVFGLAARIVGVNPIPMKIAFEMRPRTHLSILYITLSSITSYIAYPFVAIGLDKLAVNLDDSEKLAIAAVAAVVFIWALFLHKYLVEHITLREQKGGLP